VRKFPTPVLRAVALAGGICSVVIAARLALDVLPLSPADALALDALASATTLALAAFAVAVLGATPLRTRLGLRAGRLRARDVALATLGTVSLSHAAERALELAGVTSPGLLRFETALADLGLANALFPLLALSLGAACGEELFFRGLLQRGLAARIGPPAALALASLAFGAAHGDWAHGAAALALGAYLGAIAHAADSIRPAVVAHATNNALALLERIAGFELPHGRVATPLLLVASTTLACVALAVALRAGVRSRLQGPARPAD
jgi:membrane protease YdiL (CAAX protease family)